MSHHDQAVEQSHKKPNYLLVFGILFVLTMVEIGITLIPGFNSRVPLLLIMLGKASLVAMFYMHLQSDSKWFAAFFLAPLPFVALMFGVLMLRTLP